MTPLETLQTRVLRRLDDEFVQFLLDKAVDFHCRKGTRGDCDCSYCQKKNDCSVRCGDFAGLWQEYKRRFDPCYRPVGITYGEKYDRYYQTSSVEHMRGLIKNEFKYELQELKQDVLYA